MSTLDYLQAGESQARRELEVGEIALTPAERGVAVKYALAEALADRFGSGVEARQQWRNGELTLATLRETAAAALRALLAAAQVEHLERPELQARVADLAIDALLSERLAPEVLLLPERRALPGPVHALVFSAFTHCTHELYPLLVDALTAGVPAVGAHESWLGEGRLRRGILLDAEANRLLEMDFDRPVTVDRAQVLALDLTREAESHRQIERSLSGVPFTNPYAGARFLDDKVWTTSVWATDGLDVPAFLAFNPGTPDTAMRGALADWLCTHNPRLVVKPADGTEGRGVALVDFAQAGERANCFTRLNRLIERGPALVMEERGLLRYAAPWGPVRFTFRLNVCWDGTRAWAESGYAQAAGSPEGVASAGRGGRVVPLAEVWAHLQQPDGQPFPAGNADWQAVMHTAEAGTAALAEALGPDMSRLIGLDLLLDLGDDGIVPVLLEANPRPAGMSHACFVTAEGPTTEPGATRRLFGSADL
ncbi:MAG: hypothetical protein ACYDCO_09315 [Armatimonadota bacterium]